jgi:hypothetical protein
MDQWRRGWDSNPRTPVKMLLEFQSSAFDRSATSPFNVLQIYLKVDHLCRYGKADRPRDPIRILTTACLKRPSAIAAIECRGTLARRRRRRRHCRQLGGRGGGRGCFGKELRRHRQARLRRGTLAIRDLEFRDLDRVACIGRTQAVRHFQRWSDIRVAGEWTFVAANGIFTAAVKHAVVQRAAGQQRQH